MLGFVVSGDLLLGAETLSLVEHAPRATDATATHVVSARYKKSLGLEPGLGVTTSVGFGGLQERQRATRTTVQEAA